MATASRFFTVQSAEVDALWPQVVRHVDRWIEHDGTLTAAEVKVFLKTGKAQLWCLGGDEIVGIWVTRIESTERVTWGVVWGCAGDFQPHKEEAVEMFERIEEWFRAKGCEFSEWSGREGWARIFPEYQRHAVVLRKKL